MKLFGVVYNQIRDDESARIWLIMAKTLEEARHKFYDSVRHEKVPPLIEVNAPDPDKDRPQIWEVEYERQDVSLRIGERRYRIF